MRRTILTATTCLTLIAPGIGLAQEVTPAGAETIQQRLTHYLPKDLVDAGLITVKAATSVYELRYDPAVFLDKVKTSGLVVEGLKPLTAYLQPLSDGTYKVESNETFDIKGTLDAAPGKNSFTYLIDQMSFNGIYDPEILYVSSGIWQAKRIAVSSTTPQGTTTAAFGEMSMQMQAENKTADKLDLKSSGVLNGLTQTVAAGPQGRVDIGADKVDIDLNMDGARYKALQALVFFVLDHMDKKEIPAPEQVKLKELLRAAMPVFENLHEKIAVSNLKVGTEKGTFGAETVAYAIDMNGIVPSTRVGVGFEVARPSVPPGLIPPGFEGLLPDSATMKMAYADLNLAGALDYFLAHGEFGKTEPLTPEQKAEITRILLPTGNIVIDIDDASLVSSVYDVHISGKMLAPPDQTTQKPEVDVTITMRDFDKTITYLQRNAGAVPQFGQASFFLLMMKGMARDGGSGALAWDIAVGPDGKPTINGRPLPFQQ